MEYINKKYPSQHEKYPFQLSRRTRTYPPKQRLTPAPYPRKRREGGTRPRGLPGRPAAQPRSVPARRRRMAPAERAAERGMGGHRPPSGHSLPLPRPPRSSGLPAAVSEAPVPSCCSPDGPSAPLPSGCKGVSQIGVCRAQREVAARVMTNAATFIGACADVAGAALKRNFTY